MKIVEYILEDNPFVGTFVCPDCSEEILAWKSSGMSEQWPHFYCSDCSNAIHRQADQLLIWEERNQKKLNMITSSLPDCACGGKFSSGANPKCPTCNHEFKHRATPLKRLIDPHIILINGAIKYGDKGPEYQVVIKSKKARS